jgi:predicted O-methyltransferase YrrM
MNTSSDLNLDLGWRITEQSFRCICDKLRENDLGVMIEFGSGASTVRWALEFPNVKVISVEHDSTYLAETERYIALAGVQDRVTLLHSPLASIWINGRRYVTYKPPSFTFTTLVDCVIIDGPPSVTRRGREACLYYIYDVLKIGGIIVLDDATRHDERTIVESWTSVYPGSFAVSFADVGNGLAILKKVKHSNRHLSPSLFLDNYRLLLSQLRQRLTSRLSGTSAK